MSSLSEENNWEKHLEKLSSYEEYKKLDAVDISGYSDDFCVKKLGSTKKEDIELCNKVSKHLERLSGISDDKIKHGCFYFQYWFYDQVRKKYSAGNQFNNKAVSDKFFDLVQLKIDKSSNLKPCKCYVSGTPEGWKEEKDLHDYFENHKDIDCTKSDKSTCKKYVSYVTYIDKLYQNKEYDCCEDDELYDDNCEPYINCKSKYRTQDLLTKLKSDLKTLEAKEKEVPKAGGGGDAQGAVVVNKAAGSDGQGRDGPGSDVPGSGRPGSDGPGSEKNAPGIAGAQEGKDLPAKPVAAKPAAAKPVAAKPAAVKPPAEESGGSPPEVAKPPATVSGETESGVGRPADVKPEGVEQRAVLKPEVGKQETAGPAQQEAAAAPPAPRAPAPTEPKETLDEPQVPEVEVDKEAPEETAAEDGVDEVAEVAEEEEPGPLEGEETVILQDTATVSAPSVQDSGAAVHVAPYYTPELAGNAAPLTNVDAPSAVGTIHEELDSNFFRNVIMAVASSRLESSYCKKKKKKGKIFEHNYYEEYEKELEMYGSEETFLDSETDRLYLNYHPDQDSYY
ncbi:PIR protein [Plasmodium vivax]|nr:PIR protein [Plasmodium vivax]